MKKGLKVHLAGDTLGHLLALQVMPADEQDQPAVKELAKQVQRAMGRSVSLVCRSRFHGRAARDSRERVGDSVGGREAAGGEARDRIAAAAGVVERSLAWATRFRRLAKDYERLSATVAGLHYVVFAIPMQVNYAVFRSA